MASANTAAIRKAMARADWHTFQVLTKRHATGSSSSLPHGRQHSPFSGARNAVIAPRGTRAPRPCP